MLKGQRIKAADILTFIITGENEQPRPCNCCGKTASYPEMQQAKIFPFEESTEDCCFVVCSDRCRKKFLSFPTLDHYIMKLVKEIEWKKRLVLRDVYVEWFERLTYLSSNN